MGFWKHRFALYNLVQKDFKVRYRNMSLGFLWSVINPLIMLGVLVFVFTYVLKIDREPYFAVFLLTGLVLYNFMSLCLSASTTCIKDNASVVKKIIFPRMIIPVSVVFAQVIHLLIQLCVVGIFMLVLRVPISITLMWLPVILVVEIIFITGAALICSCLNVYFRDIQYLVESALTVLFWFTPIFYSLETARANLAPWLFRIYILNPLAGCISAARNAVVRQAHPEPLAFGIATAVAFVAFGVGVLLFSKLHTQFADRI
jgi:lipopolysaccharide transport system permease protein